MAREHEFFRTLFGDCLGQRYIELRCINRHDDLRRQLFFSSIDAFLNTALVQASRWDHYFGIHPRDSENGTSEAVSCVTCIAGDVDFKNFNGSEQQTVEQIQGFPLPPTVVNRSGHGFQPFWLLKEPEELDDPGEFRQIVKGVHRLIGSDPVDDPPRVLRVPGTQNYKNLESVVHCKVVFSDYSRRYIISDFEEFALSPEDATQSSLSAAPKVEDTIQIGNRNRVLASIVGSMRRRGLTAEEMGPALHAVNKRRCKPPLERSEVQKIVESICRYPPDRNATFISSYDNSLVVPKPSNEVLPFPLEVLPTPLRKLVEEGAKAINCPPDFIAVPALTAAGTAIGNSRVIQLKSGWKEGPRFFGAVVGDPGSKKSPAQKLALSPFTSRQQKLASHYEAAKEKHEAALAEFSIHEEVWKKGIKKGTAYPDDKPVPPEEPVMSQLLSTDSTLEALGDLLEQNSRGVLFGRDENTGWVRGMNQYRGGKGADRQAWLSFWNGATVIINRKNRRAPLVLDNPLVNVCGGLPPDVLEEFNDEQGREDGFIHRILFAFPNPVPGKWTENEINFLTQNDYAQLFEQLWALEPSIDEDGRTEPVAVSFTLEGRALWVEWVNAHYLEQTQTGFWPNLKGPWAKLEGYCARFALTLHLCRYVSGEVATEKVDGVSVASAADLVEYFKSDARRVYPHLHSTSQDKQVTSAVAWIQKKGGRVTLRDLVTNKVANIQNAKDGKALFNEIQERGFARLEEVTPAGGGPRSLFCVLV